MVARIASVKLHDHAIKKLIIDDVVAISDGSFLDVSLTNSTQSIAEDAIATIEKRMFLK